MKGRIRHHLVLFLRGWVGSFLVALLLVTSFKSAIADWYVVPTGSMKPTIVEGDRIYANKLAYDLKVPYTTWHIASWDNPQRGDIVVFLSPADGKRLVKRVVGLPGDVIAMRDNQLIINGHILHYDTFPSGRPEAPTVAVGDHQHILIEDLTGHPHQTLLSPRQLAMRSFAPVTVPEGQYFMMGDNRDNSADSRYFGCVDRKAILARATAIVISLDILQDYHPRWTRFLTALQ